MVKYDILSPWKTLDPWQKEYIKSRGNCFLLCGRQSGKTAAMSVKIGECAVDEESGGDYLVIALTEKQAYQLFFKTLMYLEAKHHKMIKRGNDKPTKHEIRLTNGITIRCYAAGKYGDGLRTFTIKKLFIDEAAPMEREVFIAVSPMLSVTGGTMDISSTPRGKTGYFYECSDDSALEHIKPNFTRFYVSAEDCPRHTDEFLEGERRDMSMVEYAQEYLAKFLDEVKQFLPTELIMELSTLNRGLINLEKDYYLGVDIGGMGKDPSTFEIFDGTDKEDIKQVENMVLGEKTELRTTDTTDQIVILNKQYYFNGIGVDDGGAGVGVLDQLLIEDETKRKVIGLNNASRIVDRYGNKKRLLKEDMYHNLKTRMERREVHFLKDESQINSLKSLQWDSESDKVFGSNKHISEGIIRALQLIKTKKLSAFIN